MERLLTSSSLSPDPHMEPRATLASWLRGTLGAFGTEPPKLPHLGKWPSNWGSLDSQQEQGLVSYLLKGPMVQ